MSILDEWLNTSRDYLTRVRNLRGEGTGDGLNGSNFLRKGSAATLVLDPGSADVLLGGLGRDWFIDDDLTDSVDQITTGNAAELRD